MSASSSDSSRQGRRGGGICARIENFYLEKLNHAPPLTLNDVARYGWCALPDRDNQIKMMATNDDVWQRHRWRDYDNNGKDDDESYDLLKRSCDMLSWKLVSISGPTNSETNIRSRDESSRDEHWPSGRLSCCMKQSSDRTEHDNDYNDDEDNGHGD